MTIRLPFNTTMIRTIFTPLPPEQETDRSPGFWAVLQGTSLVVPAAAEQALLPIGTLPESLTQITEPLRIGLWQEQP
jgi:hypothetical protein